MTHAKPWAFDECAQFQNWRRALEARGITMRVALHAKTGTGFYRGDDLRKVFFYDSAGTLVTAGWIEGQGPQGFAVYLIDEALAIDDGVRSILTRAYVQRAAERVRA